MPCRILCLALICLAWLPGGEVALAGQVVDSAGVPLDGVLVRLLGADLTTVTGSDGRWAIAEGTPRALFPGRLSSTSRISWSGPGGDLQVEARARTGVTVLMFAGDGTQLAKQQFTCTGSGSFRLAPPAATVLVGIATQACDRVVYVIDGGRAMPAFSTCPGAEAGTTMLRDIVSFELPGRMPTRVALDTLVEPKALARPVRLTAIATTVTADPTTLAGLVPRLKGGETVLLADGHYGAFEQRAASGYAWWVTFTAAPGAKPVFDRIALVSASNEPDGGNDMWMCFDGLQITDGVEMRGARWVDLRNCSIRRQGAVTGSMADIEKAGIGFRQCRGIRIEGCEVTNAGNGISGTGNHIIYRRNHVHDCGQDGLHFLGGHDFLCEYNDVHDFDDGTGDRDGKSWNMHDDCLQMYPIWAADEPANWLADCTMRGNRFYRPEAMGWMIQSKRQDQLKRFLFENNITAAVPGYMFHMKDSCDGVVLRFNSFLIPPAGFQYTGKTGRSFDTARGNNLVAVPSRAAQTTFVEVYGNIMGGRNEIDGPKLTRCDNNIYYGSTGGGRQGVGERSVGAPPFVDVTSMLAVPSGPAIAGLVLPPQPSERQLVPLPAYDANGNPRSVRTCIGAVDVNARPAAVASAPIRPGRSRRPVSTTPAPVAKPPPARPVEIPATVRAAWDRRLLSAIRTAASGGIPAGYSSRLWNGEVVVSAVTDDGDLSVRLASGGSMVIGWRTLAPSELAGLADSCVAGTDEKRLLRGFYHLLAVGRTDAEPILAEAGAEGSAVLQLFAAGPATPP